MKVRALSFFLILFLSCHVRRFASLPTPCVDSASKGVPFIELLDNGKSYHGMCVITEREMIVKNGLQHPFCGIFGDRLIQTTDTPLVFRENCGIRVEIESHTSGQGLDSLNGRRVQIKGVLDTQEVPLSNCWLATLKYAAIISVLDSAR